MRFMINNPYWYQYPLSLSLLLITTVSISFIHDIQFVNAWGREGHEIVADIAYQRLSTSTQNAIAKVLFPSTVTPYDKTKYASPLSAVASWADTMRYTKDFAWTTPLHFVDIRDDLISGGCPSTSVPIRSVDVDGNVDDGTSHSNSNCSFIYSRDCGNGLCAVNAIQQLSLHLNNHTSSSSPSPPSFNTQTNQIFQQWEKTPGLRGLKSYQKKHDIIFTIRQSLMFLIHFIGDIHQPLHVSRKSDVGGNTILVSFPQQPYHPKTTSGIHRDERYAHVLHKGWNLHSVWDTGIIEYVLDDKYNNTQSEFQSFIEKKYLTKRNIHEWTRDKCDDGSVSGNASGNASNATGKNESCITSAYWADESWNDALSWAYGDENGDEVSNGSILTVDYIYSRLPIIEMRLAAAGVRLAHVLEMIYSDNNRDEDEIEEEI